MRTAAAPGAAADTGLAALVTTTPEHTHSTQKQTHTHKHTPLVRHTFRTNRFADDTIGEYRVFHRL